MIFIIKF